MTTRQAITARVKESFELDKLEQVQFLNTVDECKAILAFRVAIARAVHAWRDIKPECKREMIDDFAGDGTSIMSIDRQLESLDEESLSMYAGQVARVKWAHRKDK